MRFSIQMSLDTSAAEDQPRLGVRPSATRREYYVWGSLEVDLPDVTNVDQLEERLLQARALPINCAFRVERIQVSREL